MAKSAYINRFNITMDSIAQEAIISFFSAEPILNDKFEPVDTEHHEVSKVVMTEYNLRALYNTIGNLLMQITEQKK